MSYSCIYTGTCTLLTCYFLWNLNLFSTLFQLYRNGHCTYPSVPWVSVSKVLRTCFVQSHWLLSHVESMKKNWKMLGTSILWCLFRGKIIWQLVHYLWLNIYIIINSKHSFHLFSSLRLIQISIFELPIDF